MKKRLFSEFCLGLVFSVLLLSACAPGNEEPSEAELAEESENAEATETAMSPIQRGLTFLSDKSNPLIGEIKFELLLGAVTQENWGHLHNQIIAEFTGDDVVSLFRVNDGNTVKAMVLDFSETGFLSVYIPNGGELRVVYTEGDVWEGSLGGPGFYVRFLNGEVQFR